MGNKIIICDSREQHNEEVIKYFKLIKQPFLERVKVDAGDYIYATSENRKDFDYSTVIDLKADMVEVAGNVAGTKKEHERFKREVATARELGCKRFVVLIREPLKTLEDVQTWQTPKLRNGKPIVKRPPVMIYKTMKTMSERYGIEWQFTTRLMAGRDIIAILNGDK